MADEKKKTFYEFCRRASEDLALFGDGPLSNSLKVDRMKALCTQFRHEILDAMLEAEYNKGVQDEQEDPCEPPDEEEDG